ncbi:Protein of unknown function [Albimonas donghaensis]|uniref:DUF3489 domain-containing protein n=1 Tax=Albimonas donghaensis TaxID=356660 RepID=A0A1H3G8N4_9RHOB|nr:DUF3489 domain-containing protein [Albimonas donghaensis]SDX98854.1 Protein of unknown function [Albimonas donghaensis]
MTQKIKLTDLQLVLLSAAAARPDFMLLPPPESVRAKGKTLERALARLLDAGLVEEVTARHDAEAWRVTEDGVSFGLRIASAGMDAIGLPGSSAEDGDAALDATAEPDVAPTSGEPAPADEPAPAKPHFRPGTKQARLVEMISAPDGAGIDALSETLGWQVHTTRAALTGVRKKGLAVESAKGADGKAVYRIAGEEVGSDAA